jgi:hypothetical protein
LCEIRLFIFIHWTPPAESAESPLVQGKEFHHVSVRLLFLSLLCTASGVTHAANQDEGIAGHYTLQAREIGSQLVLQPDSTFDAMIVYAGAQGAAKGHWKRAGDTLLLTSDAVEPPAEKLLFNLSRTHSLAELKDAHLPDGGDAFKQAKNHYVLNLRFARSSPVPSIAPVTVLFEFDEGPETRLIWDNAQGRQLYLPYSQQRNLTRIGFQSAADQAVQWFAIDPVTRTLSLNWKVDRATGQMSYEKSEELTLVQSQQFLRNAPRERALIERNYVLRMNYGVPAQPPAIKPVVIEWSYDDGSQKILRWTDSRQSQLKMPVEEGKTLQRLGLRMSDAQADTQWFEVEPDSRALDLMWDERVNAAQMRDLSGIFKTLALDVKGDCLAVDLGNGLACYRKQD